MLCCVLYGFGRFLRKGVGLVELIPFKHAPPQAQGERIANELIGIDELAAIQVIANVIESGGAAADAMRDVYDFITGDEWRDIDAAEAWLQENYDSDGEEADSAPENREGGDL
jgi:hypothetical protein